MELEFAIRQTHVHELNKNAMKLELASYHESTIEQNCHVLVTTLYNVNFACQLIYIKENLKYWKETRNMKTLYVFITYFVHL